MECHFRCVKWTESFILLLKDATEPLGKHWALNARCPSDSEAYQPALLILNTAINDFTYLVQAQKNIHGLYRLHNELPG